MIIEADDRVFRFREDCGGSVWRCPGDNFRSFVSRFSLERGIVAGAGIALAGFALAAYSLWIWVSTGFSALDPRDVMRIVIPSLTLSVIGIELVLSSFVLYFLMWNVDANSRPFDAAA